MKPTSGISGQAKTAGVDGDKATDATLEKPLSKRQKWRLKCRAKRLRRREIKKNSMSESTNKEEEQAERTKATYDRQQLHNVPAPAVSRNHSQTHKLHVVRTIGTGGVSGGVGTRKLKVERSDQHPGVKLSRKRKRKGVESSKEEAEFAEMVAKYRRKLQRTSA